MAVNHGKSYDSVDGNWDFLKTFKRIETYGNVDFEHQIMSKSVIKDFIVENLGGNNSDFKEKIMKKKKSNEIQNIYRDLAIQD